MRGAAQIHIVAPPQRVYEMVSDVTRMGEWSPECYRCEWIDRAARPAVGARFMGHNRCGWLRWSRTVVVTAAEPGREFAFATLTGILNRDSTVWRYRFEPADGGTTVTESYEGTSRPTLLVRVVSALARRPHDMVPAMKDTLERIKAAAETPR